MDKIHPTRAQAASLSKLGFRTCLVQRSDTVI